MKIYLSYLLLGLLSFSIQAAQLKISAPVKHVTLGFSTVAIAPSNPNILYGGIESQTSTPDNESVYRSIDAGQHWQGLPTSQSIRQLVVSPTNPFVLYAVVGGDGPSPQTNLLKSEDGGETWQAQDCCLSFGTIRIDRSNELVLYGTTFWSRPTNEHESFLRKSVDGGKTWKSVILPEEYQESFMDERFSLLPSNDGYIDPAHLSYMHSNDAIVQSEVVIYDSSDGGNTWKKLEFAQPPNKLQTPSEVLYLYGGIGQLWLGASGTTDTLYATFRTIGLASFAYLLKSNDHGVTWQRILPRSGENETLLGISPSDSNTLYATGGNGNLMRSKDAGTTWENLVFVDATTPVTAFLISPLNTKEIYVNTSNKSFPEDNSSGVYKSFDGGDTWEMKTGRDAILEIVNITSTIQKDTIIVELSHNEFFRTLDAGDSFQQINVPISGTVEITASNSNPSTLYATNGQVLYRSDDIGETWKKISPWESEDYRLKFFQSPDGKTLYGRQGGLVTYLDESYGWYYSEDFGNTWQIINVPIQKPNLTAHPNNPNMLYIIGYESFRSMDKGQTWQPIQTNLAENTDYAYATAGNNLLSDPHDVNTLYFLNVKRTDRNYDIGYRSLDAGVTWNLIKAPSDNWLSNSFSQLDPSTGFLYTISSRSSENIRYRSTDGGNIWIELKNLPPELLGRWYDRPFENLSESGLYFYGYRSIDNGDSWQWILSIYVGVWPDPLYNRFFMIGYSWDGKLGIFTVDEQAVANPQSTISDALGHSYSSSQDVVKTLVDSLPTTNKQLSQNSDTQITATFSPSEEYQNQGAELFIISQFQPQGSAQSYWFMQTNNTWQAWDGSEANLKPVKTVSSLQATETLDIFTGKPLGLVGTTTIYTGYRISAQGILVSNIRNPLVLKVE